MSFLVHALLVAAGVYLGLGLVFAVPFVVSGVRQVDRAAAGATLGFRVIILPGVVALWPVLARRWWRGAAVVERTAHRNLAAAREVRS